MQRRCWEHLQDGLKATEVRSEESHRCLLLCLFVEQRYSCFFFPECLVLQ